MSIKDQIRQKREAKSFKSSKNGSTSARGGHIYWGKTDLGKCLKENHLCFGWFFYWVTAKHCLKITIQTGQIVEIDDSLKIAL
jgi:hypothetical protein